MGSLRVQPCVQGPILSLVRRVGVKMIRRTRVMTLTSQSAQRRNSKTKSPANSAKAGSVGSDPPDVTGSAGAQERSFSAGSS